MAIVNLGSIKFNWKGAYSGATAYVVDDVVESGGNSYVCILASTGNTPPNATYWELMASKGTDTSVLTTQGDVLYHNGSSLARLGAGSSGQALISGGTGANPSWGDAGGGKILQIQTGTTTSLTSFNSTSFVAMGLSVNITPSASNSKIFLLSNFHIDDDAATIQLYSTIFRDSTNLGNGSSGLMGTYSDGRLRSNHSATVMDTPNTTSQITYEVYARAANTGARNFNSEGSLCTITAMEVGA